MAKKIMSRPTFVKYIERLEIAFRYTLGEKELDVYYAHLKSLPENVLSENIDHLILTNRFFPKVSEIWNNYTFDDWKPCDPKKQQEQFRKIFK